MQAPTVRGPHATMQHMHACTHAPPCSTLPDIAASLTHIPAFSCLLCIILLACTIYYTCSQLPALHYHCVGIMFVGTYRVAAVLCSFIFLSYFASRFASCSCSAVWFTLYLLSTYLCNCTFELRDVLTYLNFKLKRGLILI